MNIKFHEPFVTGDEMHNMENVIAKKRFYGFGDFTELCYNELSNKFENKNILLTDSCTSALEISALIIKCNWKHKSKPNVIIPSYTFSSTAAAFAKFGFDIKFTDINPATAMIDLEHARTLINENTAAIVIVHYGGAVPELQTFADEMSSQGIAIVEDAAQSFGVQTQEGWAGLSGDFGCFSFHETKNLHCGLGGLLYVKSLEDFKRARYILERGTNRVDVIDGKVDKYTWVELGGSYNLSELHAAFLYAQLSALDYMVEKRKLIWSTYENNLRSNYCIEHRINYSGQLKANYHAYWITLRDQKATDIIDNLQKKHGITAFIGYVPLHSSPVARKYHWFTKKLDNTDIVAERLIRLPIHQNMDVNQAQMVIHGLNIEMG